MWRPAQTRAVTGTNDTPLPNRRRFGPILDDHAPPPPPGGGGYGAPSGPPGGGGGGYGGPPRDQEYFNGRPPVSHGGRDGGDYERERGRDTAPVERREDEPASDQPRKRRSRWGDAADKTSMPGLPSAIMGNVSQSELDNYAIHVRLEEINGKLRTGDVVPPERMRSPSPAPQYDTHGRRTNTREIRYRKKLEDERVKLIDRALKSDPNFRPPAEYHVAKRNNRPQEKVYIPKDEFPEINFFGLLVGPRGNSLKKMESESGAKISIRGKGSVKEGKGRPDAFAADEEDELHCLVMGDTQEKVDKCVALINRVIETAASVPEGQNDHKRNQLRELASLNGTLRDDENQLCQNCGEKGHRKFECPQARTFHANVICRACGSAGHMARDCMNRNGAPAGATPVKEFDSEYQSLMAELGEGGAPAAGGGPVGAITNGAQGDRPPWGGAQAQGAAPGPTGADGKKIPPWRIPENWFSNRPPQGAPGGGGGFPGGGYQQGGYQQQQGAGGGYQAAGYAGYQQQQQQQQTPEYAAWAAQQQQYAQAYGQQAGGADAYAAYYAQLAQAQAQQAQAQPAA